MLVYVRCKKEDVRTITITLTIIKILSFRFLVSRARPWVSRAELGFRVQNEHESHGLNE